jgi:ATPase family associated with various cellular activities (AAA)
MDPLTLAAADVPFSGTLAVGEAGDRLERFIQTELRIRKAEIEEIKDLIRRVLDVFTWSFVDGDGWPYEVVNARSLGQSRDFSFSTVAMIAFSLSLATGRIRESSLVPAVRSLPALVPEKTAEEINSVISKALDLSISKSSSLEETWQSRRKEKSYPDPLYEPPHSDSGTFGWDDPFTLTWLLELLASERNSDRQAFRAKLEDRAWSVVQPVLRDPQSGFLQVEAGEEVSHAFQLLRVIQLVLTLQRIRGTGRRRRRPDLSRMRGYLLQRVHLRLSESRIQESGFDAADLVFSLEGSMLAAPSGQLDLALVDAVFRVLAERQASGAYWRPLRPFKSTSPGLILLPQSVEIANSLLRICNSPPLDREGYFSEHVSLLDLYTQWLRAHVFRGFTRRPRRTFIGWESEHTYRADRIHLWQTSQALIFLQHYVAMVQQHIARRSLDLAGFAPRTFEPKTKNPFDPVKEWNVWKVGEPIAAGREGGRYRVYESIERDFIEPRIRNDDGASSTPDEDVASSMLLYGPPGTGKSTIVEELARALQFPLITVTPSDFISSGGEAVEARAKAIFEVLLEQNDLVVLFDEIDQLLLDRDSSFYRSQDDLFKLLTPGMLTEAEQADERAASSLCDRHELRRADRSRYQTPRSDRPPVPRPPAESRPATQDAQKSETPAHRAGDARERNCAVHVRRA